MRRLGGTVARLVLAATLAACSGGSGGPSADPAGTPTPGGSPPSTSGAGPDAAWPTYHRTGDRAGNVADLPKTTALAAGWSRGLDKAVYGQPLVIGDAVVVATEGNTVYTLALADGRQRWSRALGKPVRRKDLPCGNIDPLGITGTPAYDQTTGTVFVATETTGARHTLVGLDVLTGAIRVQLSLDVLPDRDRHAEQQRGALLVSRGQVYVPFGGLAGDCGNYVGYVAGVRTDGTGGVRTYAVPTEREGGMWAPSGVAVSQDGDLWVAVGNGASFGEPYDGSDSVLRLSPDLSTRKDFFAPRSWGDENAADADLGSTGPLILDRDRVLISGKTGDVYLLDATKLGGIAGEVASIKGCSSYGGMAWDAEAQAAFVPCAEGLMRVDVGARTLTAGWRADPVSVAGSPVIGGGAVFSLDAAHGRVYVFDAATGRVVTDRRVGDVTRFASPVLAEGRVVIGTTHGVIALHLR